MGGSVRQFEFKSVDQEGFDTLDTIADAKNFNRWMYNSIKPYCKGRILEIGSGLGNISKCFIEDGAQIFLSDIRDSYCKILHDNFSAKPNVLGVENIDLVDPDFDTKYAKLLGSFDTLFALNVVEHIENDQLAIANCKKLMADDGNLIILVPAYQSLYNRFDKELYHYRRYRKQAMAALFRTAGIAVKRSFYFNALGIAGWVVSGRFMKNKIIPRTQLRFYDKILPLAKMLDAVLFNSMGLSAVVVGKKEKAL